MKHVGILALLTLNALACGPCMAQSNVAANCTPLTTLQVDASAGPDVDPALPGVQVRLGTNVQVSGFARLEMRTSTCGVTEAVAPLAWSLSFQPPQGAEIDVTDLLTPATIQTRRPSSPRRKGPFV